MCSDKFKMIEMVGTKYRSLCESVGTLTYSREHVLEILTYVDISVVAGSSVIKKTYKRIECYSVYHTFHPS